MLPLLILNRIESAKIRYLCHSYIDGIHDRLGKYFHIYIKDFYYDENELEITVGLLPKPTTVFVSKYIDLRNLNKMLPSTNDRTFIFVDPGKNKNPFNITKYNLHKLIAPINHKHNINTELEQTKILLRNVMSTDTLIDTGYGGVEGIRVDPSLLNSVLI